MHPMTATPTAPVTAATPAAPGVPERPVLEGLEAKWSAAWKDAGTYTFVRPESRDEVFSIDTPPPTVSGSLHVGHVFSYTHTDLVARYQRMRGKRVFYPMGWDDNGLPTERRVQNYYGVRCDPSIPFDADFVPPANPDPKRQIPISRKNFIELCHQLTAVDEQVFESLWRTLGLSVDWDTLYATISDESQRIAQKAFLRNHSRGEAYLSEAPTLWDVTFHTAVAQAELEAREYPGHYYRVAFGASAGPIHIETTRPELIPAVCALIAHPDDTRYAHLFGTTVISPVFGVEIPVLAAPCRRARQGGWHRHVLHLRRPHRRPVVARTPTAHPDRPDPRRPAAGGPARVAGQPGALRGSGRQDRPTAPARPWWRCSARPGTSTASPSRPPGWPTSSRRATSRSRSSPPASGTSATGAATTTSRPPCWPEARTSPGSPIT